MTLPPIWPRCPSTVISHHNLPNCPSLWNNEWTPSIRRPATSSSTPLSTSSTNTHSTAGWKGLEGRLTALSITISGSRSGTSRWHSTTTTTSRRSALKYCRIWSPGWSPTKYYHVLMFYMRSSCSSSSSPLHIYINRLRLIESGYYSLLDFASHFICPQICQIGFSTGRLILSVSKYSRYIFRGRNAQFSIGTKQEKGRVECFLGLKNTQT